MGRKALDEQYRCPLHTKDIECRWTTIDALYEHIFRWTRNDDETRQYLSQISGRDYIPTRDERIRTGDPGHNRRPGKLDSYSKLSPALLAYVQRECARRHLTMADIEILDGNTVFIP
jgi:hypothetical protein